MPFNMDIGYISGEKGSENVFKRKFRWTLSMGNYLGGAVGDDTEGGYMWYARVANRPTLTVEETQIDHLHEKHYISGKPTWETIGITIYDVKKTIGSSSASELSLHLWLNSVFRFSDNNQFAPPTGNYRSYDMGDHNLEYKKDLTLRMLDGHGATMESWILSGAWPTSTVWGDLDYSSSDTADVEITVRFDRAKFYPAEPSSSQMPF